MGGTIARSTGVIGQWYYPQCRRSCLFPEAHIVQLTPLPPPPLFSATPWPKSCPKSPTPTTTWALCRPCHLHNRHLLQTLVPHIHPPSLPLPEPPTPKGAGMIHPTLLGILFTDAPISHSTLHLLPASAIDNSFNSISVNGSMSTRNTVPSSPNGATGRIEINYPLPLPPPPLPLLLHLLIN